MKTCPACVTPNPDTATFCSNCGHDLSRAPVSAEAGWSCPTCATSNGPAARFCSNCGTKRPAGGGGGQVGARPAQAPGRTMFFSAAQAPTQQQAKLVLVRGTEWEGVTYQLSADHHIAGRTEGFMVFGDDPFVSPMHCDFYYENGVLMLADLGSANGVYVRLRGPLELTAGAWFRIGEQLFRFDTPDEWPPIEGLKRRGDGTQLFGSPVQAAAGTARLEHILEGGTLGAVYLLDRPELTIGRTDCALSFPVDRYISGRHARILKSETGFTLEDLNSKNGTFVRVGLEPIPLQHGDYVFVGQQLIRVDMV